LFSVRRLLVLSTLVLLGGQALAQGPAEPAAPKARSEKEGSPGSSGQSKSWADEVRSSIAPQKGGAPQQGGAPSAGEALKGPAARGQPKQ
jgi:hypothetical protein